MYGSFKELALQGSEKRAMHWEEGLPGASAGWLEADGRKDRLLFMGSGSRIPRRTSTGAPSPKTVCNFIGPLLLEADPEEGVTSSLRRAVHRLVCQRCRTV